MQSSRFLSSAIVPALAKNQALRRAVLRPVAAVQHRDVSTAPLSIPANLDLLNKQRALRPSSPHFTIYQPQLTWLSSIANRVTGTGLSVGMYALFIGHLLLPAVGVPFDSATLVTLFAELPTWAKISAKSIVTLPAAFHTFNGLRHLAWDMGYLLELRDSYIAGYSVIGISVVSTAAIVAM